MSEPATLKRLRDEIDSLPTRSLESSSAPASRSALSFRAGDDSILDQLREAASAAGMSSTDAFLCLHGRSIADALRALSAAAEVARTELHTMRAALISAVNERCDYLARRIDDAESSKVAAFERELCAVDAALEHWRAERRAVAEAAASLDDSELSARHAELTARLNAAEEQIAALPIPVNELPHISLVANAPALLADVAVYGQVVAPLVVTANDLSVRDARLTLAPGRSCRFLLQLTSNRHASQSTDELAISLGAAAPSVRASASLVYKDQTSLPLTVTTVSADIAGRCLTVSFDIPPTGSASAESFVAVQSVTVSGRLCLSTPLRISVQREPVYFPPSPGLPTPDPRPFFPYRSRADYAFRFRR